MTRKLARDLAEGDVARLSGSLAVLVKRTKIDHEGRVRVDYRIVETVETYGVTLLPTHGVTFLPPTDEIELAAP